MTDLDDMEIFYRNHRGGGGAVIMVTAINDADHSEQHGIFGSIDTAHEWRRHLGDGYTCVFAPYIVDDPDWGNEARGG
jgi:hypothetical protein